ncbi:MAG: AraC family transcriptional regulator [Gemmatimonadaceae bacterium]|nr:AraC family transcriptional regulator [Gemmatimonadaceae bacterium]
MDVRTERHVDADGWWEMLTATPSPVLRDAILGPYVGWVEERRIPLVRRETPALLVPCILTFENAYTLRDASRTVTTVRGSFVAGMYDQWVDVGMPSRSVAVQANFTPLAARRIFGCPLHEITNQSVDVPSMFGAEGARLVSRMAAEPDWGVRFAMLDAFLVERWRRGARTPRTMQWAWQQLALGSEPLASAVQACAPKSAMSVGDVARALGWSARRMSDAFREHGGMSARRLQSVQRVGHATQLLRELPHSSLGVVAVSAGYADHAHFTRDLVQFTGVTPSMFRQLMEPGMQSLVVPSD